MDKTEKRSYVRAITMKQSPSYFTKEQLLQMKEIGEKMNIKIAQLRREALEFFFNKINQPDFEFSSVEKSKEKMELSNSWFTPEQIEKCKKIAKEMKISSGQIRRGAWDFYYKNLSEGKIKFYPSDNEFLSNRSIS